MFRKLGCFVVLFGSSVCFGAPFTIGDVFLSTRYDGAVYERSPAGINLQTLPIGGVLGLFGSTFDSSGNLYLTTYGGPGVTKFDSSGNPVGSFGSGYSGVPDSILAAPDGTFWIAQANSNIIKNVNSAGVTIKDYTVAIQNSGTVWIDLSPDGKTIFYTSNGSAIKRFDVANSVQLSDVVSGGPDKFALRVLADGSVLVAAGTKVIHYDASGNLEQTYLSGPAVDLFALTLDPNGKDFWTADEFFGSIYEVNIATGAIDSQFSEGTSSVTGISVFSGVSTPEPATCGLWGLGLAALSVVGKKTRGARA